MQRMEEPRKAFGKTWGQSPLGKVEPWGGGYDASARESPTKLDGFVRDPSSAMATAQKRASPT